MRSASSPSRAAPAPSSTAGRSPSTRPTRRSTPTRTATSTAGLHRAPAAPASAPPGTFTGNVTNTGKIIVQGNDSAGIALDGALTGALSTSGSIALVGDRSVGIRANAISGAARVAGTVSVQGKDAVGASFLGDIGGGLVVQGSLTATGYRSTTLVADVSKLDADDLLQGGPALSVAGNVAGGIILAVAPKDTDPKNLDEDNDGIPRRHRRRRRGHQLRRCPRRPHRRGGSRRHRRRGRRVELRPCHRRGGCRLRPVQGRRRDRRAGRRARRRGHRRRRHRAQRHRPGGLRQCQCDRAAHRQWCRRRRNPHRRRRRRRCSGWRGRGRDIDGHRHRCRGDRRDDPQQRAGQGVGFGCRRASPTASSTARAR